ncbi:hypothetical protein FV232_17345 [Methylobacterium sp. WL30]|nr:hypothetical protein FV225_11765 [Methylobacterium sp. WL93]TXN48808.1 hypothetical protein FV227_19500 [Methylobacterium sp. WL119]TXN65772.1 hypothetical protein FV232_17345 [Methylobacterium sp. WL30]
MRTDPPRSSGLDHTIARGKARALLPPPSAGEGGPRVSEGRERGATVPYTALPSPDPLRGSPSPASGGGKYALPASAYVL